VSPVIVTVEPFARFTFAVSVTVSVLVAYDTNVLCLIVLTVNTGTTTKRGFAPFVTPIKCELGVVILAAANEFAGPEASMLITGANCAEEGFVTVNANVYVFPDDRVNPV